MRRLFALCLALSVLCLAACGGPSKSGTTVIEKRDVQTEPAAEAQPLTLGTENQVPDYAAFSLFKIEMTDRLQASMASSGTLTPDQANETYIDVVLDYTNTTSSAIVSNDLLTLTAACADGTQYEGTIYALETDGGTQLSSYGDAAPLTPVRLHCAVPVPKTLNGTVTLTLDIDGALYIYSYPVGEHIRNAQALTVGQTIEAENFAALTWQGMSYTDDLLPPNTSTVFTHYQVDSPDNTYLAARFDVTNYQSTEKDCDTFVSVKAVYQDKYTYTGFAVVQDADGTGFHRDSIMPLNTRTLYILIEVPKSIIQDPVALTISFDGGEYTYSYNPTAAK